MSYDLGLRDLVTHDWAELTAPHFMRGGTYCVSGEPTATINITYNYSKHFDRVLTPKAANHRLSKDDGCLHGIRSLYGYTGAESTPLLEKAIDQLGDDVSSDYWEATEGNAKKALY